jgi:hypothetical protein
MSKLYLIFQSHEEVSTNFAKNCVYSKHRYDFVSPFTKPNRKTNILRRGHVNAKWRYSLAKTQSECYGYPKTCRHKAQMPQGVSTSIFGPLTFCVTFTMKTFFKLILMQKNGTEKF